jgi:hypothetical protein
MTAALYAVWLGALALTGDPAARSDNYFTIHVVDQQTGRGVPLVELETVNNIRCLTDSNGIVAFFEPGLMDKRLFFYVRSHGYEFPKDGFGFRGTALELTPGGSTKLAIKRINIAERLYRVTGGGIYRDSVLVGQPVPIREPLLNGLVFGQDSVLTAVYRGKLYWFWGDTNRPGYPLGNFHMPGATSDLPGQGGLDPELGVNLAYFVDDQGFARPTAQMPGEGPTWLDGLVTLADASGREQMFARYIKVKNFLQAYQQGLVRLNDQEQRFEKVAEFAMDVPVVPSGHPFRRTVDGIEYVYFATPYPLVRVRATAEDFQNLSSYEAFTCLQEGSRLDDPRLDRGEDGSLRYAWKKNTPAVGPKEQADLIQAGHLKPEEALLQLRDRDTGKPVFAHRGSVYFNRCRNKWVMIAVQSGGTSFLGEVWYAEAETPLGPWVYAVKIVTHDKYSFYNPKQHPMFDKDDGRTIFFEGTYANTFSGNPDQTPRYDYNQIMYKLDLSDRRLAIPAPVLQLSEGPPDRFGTLKQAGPLGKGDSHLLPGRPAGCFAQKVAVTFSRRRIAFFALDHAGENTVPVYQVKTDDGHPALKVGDPKTEIRSPKTEIVFHALPLDAARPVKTVQPLYEFSTSEGSRRAYSLDPSWSMPDFKSPGRPICLVWLNPGRQMPPALTDR